MDCCCGRVAGATSSATEKDEEVVEFDIEAENVTPRAGKVTTGTAISDDDSVGEGPVKVKAVSPVEVTEDSTTETLQEAAETLHEADGEVVKDEVLPSES